MKQLKIGLEDDLRAVIEASAVKRGLSLGAEIRRRLEQSVKSEEVRHDPFATQMGRDVMALVDLVLTSSGDTDEHRRHAAIAVAVNDLLEHFKPRSPPSPPLTGAAADLFDPVTWGHVSFRIFAQQRADALREYERALKAHQAADAELRQMMDKARSEIGEEKYKQLMDEALKAQGDNE